MPHWVLPARYFRQCLKYCSSRLPCHNTGIYCSWCSLHAKSNRAIVCVNSTATLRKKVFVLKIFFVEYIPWCNLSRQTFCVRKQSLALVFLANASVHLHSQLHHSFIRCIVIVYVLILCRSCALLEWLIHRLCVFYLSHIKRSSYLFILVKRRAQKRVKSAMHPVCNESWQDSCSVICACLVFLLYLLLDRSKILK